MSACPLAPTGPTPTGLTPFGPAPTDNGASALELLRRPEGSVAALQRFGLMDEAIDHAVAEQVGEHGAHVVVSSRKQDACQVVVDGINAKYGAGRAIAVAASISSKEALQGLHQGRLPRAIDAHKGGEAGG